MDLESAPGNHIGFRKNAGFKGKDLRGASFQNQKLLGADFRGSDLRDANFSNAILRGADFSDALASQADFTHADIRGVRFTNADLEQANFSNCQAGLHRVWTIIYILIALMLAAMSGIAHTHTGAIPFNDFPVVHSLDDSTYQEYNLIPRSVALTVLGIFSTVCILEGFARSLAVVTVSVTGMFLLATIMTATLDIGLAWNVVDYSLWIVAGSMAWAVFGTLTLTVSGAALSILSSKYLIPLATLAATISFGTVGVIFLEKASQAYQDRAVVVAVVFFFNCMGSYLAWKALHGTRNFIWLRKLAVFLTTQLGATDFREANLANADFSDSNLRNSILNSTVNLKNTCFYHAQLIEFSRVGKTYLDGEIVRTLIVGKAYELIKSRDFCNLNLKGVDLSGAELSQINFSDADLSEANLQDANLTRACLIRTQLNGANLSGAKLTGATIENWSITSRTNLTGVHCKYVFMKAVGDGELAQNPLRKPDSYGEEFQEGEFEDFITPLCTTLDLYHSQDVDPRAIAVSYKQLQENYPEANLDILSIEKRGKHKEGLLLKVETSENADLSKLSDEYLETYRQVKALPRSSLVFLLADHSRKINYLTQKIETLFGDLGHDVGSPSPSEQAPAKADIADFAVFTFSQGGLEQGFSINALIWSSKRALPIITSATLPPAVELQETYQRWKTVYCALAHCNSRIVVDKDDSPSNISRQELEMLSNQLENCLNCWLSSGSFLSVANKLRDEFHARDEFPIIIQSMDVDLCRLPWHLWDFVRRRTKAEVAIGNLHAEPTLGSSVARSHKRILAVLGSSVGIDVKTDREILAALLDQSAELNFMVEPNRSELYEALREAHGWDIVYFAGHSQSLEGDTSGILQLNRSEKLDPSELYYAIGSAVEKGLKIAIINSCDGLGLARKLEELRIPHIIVMKEPVPDEVAQAFLKTFLRAFIDGESLYASFREARRSLEILQDRFPCASWLPVLFKNSAEKPMTW